jgi:hypothetical protein
MAWCLLVVRAHVRTMEVLNSQQTREASAIIGIPLRIASLYSPLEDPRDA